MSTYGGSAFGGKTKPIALFDFGAALAAPQPLPLNPRFFFKPLLVVLLLLFSLVLFPWASAPERNLSADNMLLLINQDRSKLGLAPLQTSFKLEEAARSKAQDILQRDYFAHISPLGLEPWDFIKASGAPFAFAGENLALNYTSAYELINDLMGSPSHRENLLSPLFSEIGIAILDGEYQGEQAVVVVQMFTR